MLQTETYLAIETYTYS